MKVTVTNIFVPKVILEDEEALYKFGGYWYLVGALDGFDENVYKPLMPNTTMTKMLDELLQQETEESD